MSCCMLTVSHTNIDLRLKYYADMHPALVTGQLAHDLDVIGQEIEKLYGVLSEEDLKLQ